MMDQEFSGRLKDTRAVKIHFMELSHYVALWPALSVVNPHFVSLKNASLHRSQTTVGRSL